MAGGFAKTDEERIAQNSPLCSPNKPVVFKGVVMVEALDNFGKDKTRMVLTFSDKLSISIFNPGERVWDQQKAAQKLHSLCEALGLDFKDIPHCKGGWHELIAELIYLTSPAKDTELFAKITLNEKGYFTLGEGVCFSKNPDMAYTDNDKHFILDVDLREPTAFILDTDIPGNNFNLGDEPKKPTPHKKAISKPVAKPPDRPTMSSGLKADINTLGPLYEDPDPLRRASTRRKTQEEIDTGLLSFAAVSDYHKAPAKPAKGKKSDKVDPADTTGDWLDKLDAAREAAQAEQVAKPINKKTPPARKKNKPEPINPIPETPREEFDEIDLSHIPGADNLPY